MRPSALLPFLLFAPQLSGQTGVWQKTWPPSQPENVDVQMLSALEGWVLDADGGVHHTSTGGLFWSATQVADTTLRALVFRSTTGWAAGEGIFKSSDNGQTWAQVSAASGIEDLAFVDATRGWAVGTLGRTWRTLDGGASWIAGALPGVGQSLRAVHFVSATTGWLVGNSGLHARTTDGGQSWTPVTVPSAAHFSDVVYADTQRGWIAAGDRVLRTLDGGASWSSVALPAGAQAERLSLLGGNWLWTTGSTGGIALSTDAGASWGMPFGAGTPLRDVAFGDLSSGLACGLDGRIYRSTDGGQSWTLVAGGTSSTTRLVTDVTNVGNDLVWATLTDSTILRSGDGGASWTEVPAGLPQILYWAVDFLDAQQGYAVGKRQGFYPTTAWTNDGGLTWNPTYWLGMYDIGDVDAIAPQTAIACTTSGIWRTTNGGQGWSTVATAPYYTFHAADFLDAQQGWAVGYDLMKTTDGGLSWSHLSSASAALRDVSFVDASHGWAVGDGGLILRTSDGGTNWVQQSTGVAIGALYMVEALSPSLAWIAGTGGFVARTIDGGSTWTPLAPADAGTADHYGGSFTAPELGWIAGYYPTPGVWRRQPPGCAWSNYCQGKLNSAGSVAQLSVQGVPSVAQGPAAVHVGQALPNKAGMMLTSQGGPAAQPFFGGLLCLAPPLVRLPVHVTDASGQTAYTIDVLGTMVGTSRWFQFWQRDPLNPDGTGVTLSDGVRVDFCQ